MPNDKALRKHLLDLLHSGDAHADFDSAVEDVPAGLRGKRPRGAGHSPWELLEHMRIVQWDILEFIRNPKHVSPKFPDGYWPSTQSPPNARAWKQSVDAFKSDRKAMMGMVADETTDLLAPIPHGDGQTILREVLLTADHTSYHLGQFILVRRLLGAWD